MKKQTLVFEEADKPVDRKLIARFPTWIRTAKGSDLYIGQQRFEVLDLRDEPRGHRIVIVRVPAGAPL